ncbi:non-homologous end joining protein Ku [Legionella jordanis]|uniref:Non-homologous end joining protein Ku n=1 Tax=Legionella jordanis TaxID=456 RepID=A0A0W0VD59_9GAMM|nr:Ku protein [Legionella jordanis]KTD18066.1 putative DNA repair protein YkoV [Legionella jordanis]RMX02248.1 Ku protein [Legionella jordanis]RMX21266.1 Ku protein [Legionella jordanis]VEH13842.1 Ku protein [Legionella jordanis]HAT8714223.1 Ku protein [Legionella jordanis]
MARPVWKGFISFGLVAIPINLHTVEKKNELRFHLLDSRDKSRIHYERVNTEGKEVPWDDVVKAYEFKKNNYVILKDEDFERAAPEAFKTIDIEEFVDIKDVDSIYFEKPYYAIPDSANQKAYVLLREALKKTKKVGVAKVVLRTKQYLAIIMPYEDGLVLNLLRYYQEIKKPDEFDLPDKHLKEYRISPREIDMAVALVDDMSGEWKPEKYHDEYREALMKWIENKTSTRQVETKESEEMARKSDDVVDFMSLLKKSLKKKSSKGSAEKTSAKTGTKTTTKKTKRS